jgi:hypothetical protein
MAIVTVDRNVFSCFPAHDRIAIAPGQDRIPAPADQIQGLWTETGEMSVSQDPGFVAEYASPGGRLEHVTYATHREHSECL